MKEIRRYFMVVAAVAAGAPGVGAMLRGQWMLMALLLVGGTLWLNPWPDLWLSAGRRRRLAGLGCALCLGSLLAAVWFDVGMGWVLVGMAAFLAAWDLEAFTTQLAGVSHVEHEQRLVRAHLQRLAMVSITGLLMGAVGLFLRVSLDFVIALLVALLAVLGLSYVVYRLSKQEKQEPPHVTPES